MVMHLREVIPGVVVVLCGRWNQGAPAPCRAMLSRPVGDTTVSYRWLSPISYYFYLCYLCSGAGARDVRFGRSLL